MTRVLLLGANGMLGTAFRELFAAETAAGRPVELVALDLPGLDLRRRKQARGICLEVDFGYDFRPEVVLNCTGYTDVDGAEAHEEEARVLNATAPALLAESAAAAGALLVHFSTDYVFDGRKQAPYLPGDEPAPLAAYGRTKLAGERAVLAAAGEHLVVRTAWLYAPWGKKNFVRTMLLLAAERPELAVVDDQVGSPTYAPDLAQATWRLVGEGRRGLCHLVNSGQTSWCGFAREIVRLGGLSTPVRPITTAELGRPAARPAWSVLASDLPLRPWPAALAECVKRMKDAP